jgi:histidine triad (HIT) family protein
MTEETIFSKIIRQEIPTPLLYQDELVSAFRDIAPRVNTHILIVPNKHIATINEVTDDDELTMGRMITVAKKLAKEEGIAENGYRLIINCNEDGGQEVFHIHMHLLGGKKLGAMISA